MQIVFENFVGQVGARVQVSLGDGSRFTDEFRAALQGASGTVVSMHREPDRPMYGIDGSGRCRQTGMKPGQMMHQVRFDRPVVLPGPGARSMVSFGFLEGELAPIPVR